jgi:hypothetical protein
MTNKTIKIGDKVTFGQGWGTVIDKRQLAYAHEYDIKLTLGYQIVTENGYVNDQSKIGTIYTTQYAQLDND